MEFFLTSRRIIDKLPLVMKKTFTRHLKHAFIVAVAAAAAHPAVAAGDSVVVLGKDGSQYTVLMSDVKRISLGSADLVLETRDGSPATYLYSAVDRILIGADGAGIADISAEGDIAVWPTVVDDILNIAGAETGTVISVYGINGSLVASATTAEGTTSINLSAAPAGMCIVSIGGKTVKIIKK